MLEFQYEVDCTPSPLLHCQFNNEVFVIDCRAIVALYWFGFTSCGFAGSGTSFILRRHAAFGLVQGSECVRLKIDLLVAVWPEDAVAGCGLHLPGDDVWESRACGQNQGQLRAT